MKQPYRTGETPLNTIQIRGLIEDLRRVVAILDAGIAEEEAQARILDPTKPQYPFLARAPAARKANLESTLASLERRIGIQLRASGNRLSAAARKNLK
jgi:hypothetical protein